MAGRIPQSFIDDLVAATDIVEVIEHYVPLKRAGKEYKACCPFHDEKTPSFTVVPDKQFYHCFGCGAHGTAVGFLMEYANLEFVEAVEELARRIGREVPREAGGDHGPRDDLEPIFEALERANAYFRRQLRRHSQASRAVEYLKGRGLTGKIASEFQLGFAPPGWDGILRELGAEEPARAALLRAGLLVEGDGSRPYDRFRDRITFPIHDSRGRVAGFGARIIDRGEPKYLNSPETPVFRKGRELYGLWRARRAGRSPARLLVVEGYMDVVALAQSGIDYAVATLGTAATETHVQRLFRAVNDIVFCFDGDEAGRRAAWRAAENTLPAMMPGRQALFLFLPQGEDPDSLVRAEGRDAFERRLDATIPLSRFLFEHLAADTDPHSPEGGARFFDRLRPLTERTPPGPYRRQLVAQIGELYAARMPARNRSQIDSWFAELSRDDSSKGLRRLGDRIHAHAERLRISESPATRAARMLLHEPSLAAGVFDFEPLRAADVADSDLLVGLIEILRARPDLKPGALLDSCRQQEWFARIEELAYRQPEISDPDGLREEFAGCLRLVLERAEHRRAQRRLDELTKRHPSELSGDERRELTDLAARRSRGRKSASRRGD
ncbi:MAG: DNA primase [Chromatiales bacterium]|nr:DNA primase [Chromatiales bacterium]